MSKPQAHKEEMSPTEEKGSPEAPDADSGKPEARRPVRSAWKTFIFTILYLVFLLAVVVIVVSNALFVVIGAVDMTMVLIMVVMCTAGALQGILRPVRDMLMRAVIPPESFGKSRQRAAGTVLLPPEQTLL